MLLKDGIVPQMTSGQLRELSGTVIKMVPELTFQDAQLVIGTKSVLAHEIRSAFFKTIKGQRYWWASRGLFVELVKSRFFDEVDARITNALFPKPDRLYDDCKLFHFERKPSSS